MNIDATKEPKTFLTHSGAVIQTTGDVLNPVGYSGEPLEFNPDKYLREFSYGRVSKLSDGTTLREFTIIADDSKTMEISPGVFFNVWTYNGTTPGPTIRATEGD
ncbi:MAG: multicopper oxidase domain-containing protein, partial [Nitrosopumilaceae archaeon]